MSQNSVDFSGDPTGDELLDDLLTPQQENFLTSHSGTSRPSYAQAGTEWVDTTSTPWIVKRFDGSDDIIVGYINATTNTFTPAGLILDKVNATTAPTINDDDADGYSVGSKWVDVTNDLAYICVDSSTGAAVWKGITGNVTGQSSSVDSEIVLFSGTTGKALKRATGTGYVKVTSGVMGTPAATVPLTDLANQAANTVNANATGSSAAPTAVAVAANKFIARSSSGNLGAKDITDFALGLLDDADAAAMKATLGVIDPTTPGWVLLNVATPSSVANLPLTSLIDSTYDDYVIILNNVQPASNGVDFLLTISNDNGSSYLSSLYTNNTQSFKADTAAPSNTNSSNTTNWLLNGGNTVYNGAGFGINGKIELFTVNGTSIKHAIAELVFNTSTGGTNITAAKSFLGINSTSAVNAIKFAFSSGNIASGTVKLYGVRKT